MDDEDLRAHRERQGKELEDFGEELKTPSADVAAALLLKARAAAAAAAATTTTRAPRAAGAAAVPPLAPRMPARDLPWHPTSPLSPSLLAVA